MARVSPTHKARRSSRQRIEHILTAARQLLVEQGPSGLNIYAVAQTAALPPSSVYHFFPSVAALLGALTHDVHAAFRICLEIPVDHDRLMVWRDLSRIVEERMLEIYAVDAAARQLILANHGLTEIARVDQQHDTELGALLQTLFNRHFEMPVLPNDIDVFALAIELGIVFTPDLCSNTVLLHPVWLKKDVVYLMPT
jgi:AcrR family transcriptional regulator